MNIFIKFMHKSKSALIQYNANQGQYHTTSSSSIQSELLELFVDVNLQRRG